MQVIPMALKAKENFRFYPNVTKEAGELMWSGKINNDAYKDIVVFKPATGIIKVERNIGTNVSNVNFNSPISIISGLNNSGSMYHILIADMNKDGLDDILVEEVSTSNTTLSYFQNNSTTAAINFNAPIVSTVSTSAITYTIHLWKSTGTYNGIALYDNTSPSSNLELGTWNGTNFTYSTLSITNGATLKFADLNADGYGDIITHNNTTTQIKQYNYSSVSFSFTLITTLNLTHPAQLFVGHFNNTIDVDVAYYDETNLTFYVVNNSGGTLTLSTLNPAWHVNSYNPELDQNFVIDNSYTIIADDFSGDGLTDVVAYNGDNKTNNLAIHATTYNFQNATVWVGFNKNGHFRFNPWDIVHPLYCANHLTIGCNGSTLFKLQSDDFNNDSKPDLLAYIESDAIAEIAINSPILEGYCWPLSVKNDNNEQLNFYISGNGGIIENVGGTEIVIPNKIEFVKLSVNASGTLVENIYHTEAVTYKAQYISERAWRDGCEWDATFTMTINNWPSGFYAAKLTTTCKYNNSLFETQYIPFIVKAANPACKGLVVLANTNTWQAYNYWCGGIWDHEAGIEPNEPPFVGCRGKYNPYFPALNYARFSFLRPIPNAYPATSIGSYYFKAAQLDFLLGELYIYSWLEEEGYQPNLITDWDLDKGTGNLNSYSTLLFGTHPEYWTENMYDNVKNFQKIGGGLYGGNTISLGGNSIFEQCAVQNNSGSTNPEIVFYEGNNNSNRYAYTFDNHPFPIGGLKREVDLIGVRSSTAGYCDNKALIPQASGSFIFTSSNATNTNNQINTSTTSIPNGIGYENNLFDVCWLTPYSTTNIQSVIDHEADNTLGMDYAANLPGSIPTLPSMYINPAPSTLYQNPQIICSTLNNLCEMIYVPPSNTAPNTHGYILAGGATTLGGSLRVDANLQKMLRNILADLLNWDVINVTNVSCSGGQGSITVKACATNSTIAYSLNGGTPQTGSSVTFNSLNAGTYNISAESINGYTITTTATVYEPASAYNHCCATSTNPTSGNNIIMMPNMILLPNTLVTTITASNLLSAYGVGSTIKNKKFYIDGTLTIDEDITFDGCTLYFTPYSSVSLNPNYNFNVINGSILQPSCDWWGGIEALNANNKVTINNSTIKGATFGVYLLNNAVIEAENSNFLDNRLYSIYLGEMNQSPSLSIINKNTFDNPTPIAGIKSEIGIQLVNVKELNIGDIFDAASGNTFEQLKTGIYVQNKEANGSNLIGLFNNRFINIKDQTAANEVVKVNNCYLTRVGAGVYTDYGGYPSYYGNIDIRNTTTPLLPSFIECDKAIVMNASGLRAANVNTENCLLGIMCNSVYNRMYNIYDNIIDNSHVGIEIFGRQSRIDVSRNNVITGLGINLSSPAKRAPIGIKLQYGNMFVSSPVYDFTVTENNVDVSAIAGIGIYNAYGDTRLYTGGNTVNFSTNSTAKTNGYSIRSLFGFYNDGCYASTFESNSTKGIQDPNVWIKRDTKGMYFSQGPYCKINCNKAKWTRYGFYVWGDNRTERQNVTYNKFNANAYPWYFLDGPSATMGTFGDIGEPTSATPNNGNEFIYSSGSGAIDWRMLGGINTGNYKVFRNSTQLISDVIRASPSSGMEGLDQSESGSLNQPDADYKIQPEAISSDICPDNDLFNMPNYTIVDPDEEEVEEYGEAIANDSVNYISFPIVGGWIDKQKLFEQLDADSALRYSNWDLLYFYNTYKNELIGSIQNADLALSMLSDSGINNAEFMNRYMDALNANQAIANGEDWEMNDRLMNEIELKIIAFGIDTITIAEKEDIYTLASSCPFIEGSAVYKARILWSNFEPDAMFDDRVNCITSQNKNGENTKDIDIDSLYLTQIQYTLSATSNTNFVNGNEQPESINQKIKVYPNPANTQLFIEYNCAGEGDFTLYNVLGEMVLHTGLSKGSTKVLISTLNISPGSYTYHCNIKGCVSQIGKLSISK